MSTSAISIEKRRSSVLSRGWDYLELTKPKIAVLELVTVAAAAVLAGLDFQLLLHAMIGTTLVAGSASALNQWWERERDGSMRRTANRPLPAGRLTALEVLLFGAITVMLGVAYLALFVNLLTAALGGLSWVLYVLVYTPMKSRTSANTLVGAVAGAMPILMGWSAMGQPLGMEAFTLFLIVFLWQFPHFMAIAWLYREDYAAAGLKMLPVVEPTGLRAGAQAAMAALILIPVSLVPAVIPAVGNWLPPQLYFYFGWAVLLGVGQLACAISFFWRLDETSARRLLRASLVYLPGLMTALVALLSTIPA